MSDTLFNATYTASVNLTGQDVCYLMITALEGGSQYWCYAIRSTRVEDGVTTDVRLKEEETWENFKPFHVRWFDAESDEDFGEPEDNPEGWSDPIEITKERVDEALTKLYSRPRSFDVDNYDAEDADAFFQFLLLGELVYG